MNKSEQINELALALSNFQGECESPKKDKKGYSYSYADLSSYLDYAAPLLAKNGLAVTQLMGMSEQGKTLTTMLVHSSGQWISSETLLPKLEMKGASQAQAEGASITYYRRYAYAAILGMAAEDNDTNERLLDLSDDKIQTRIAELKSQGHTPQDILKNLKDAGFKVSKEQATNLLKGE